MNMRSWKLLFLICIAISIPFCSNQDKVTNNPIQTISPTDYTFVKFDPASGNPALIALPNDILRNPATGRNSVPLTGDPNVDGLVAQINTLSGFSTSGPIIIPFDGELNPATVNSSTILVVDLADLAAAQGGAQVNPFREFTFQVVTTAGNARVFGYPVRPLKPGRPHIVILTQGVQGNPTGLPIESEAVTIILKGKSPLVNAAGQSNLSSLSAAQAQALEPLRSAYQGIWGAAEAITGLDRLSIPFAYVYSTQPLFNTLPDLRAKAQASAVSLNMEIVVEGSAQVDGFLNLLGLGDVPHQGVGAIYIGTIDAPYYISDPFNGPFQSGPDGVIEQSRQAIPFIAAMPLGSGPFPTMIFQHGITRSKEDMIGIANGACFNGQGVIAIDLVLHGERTFGIDVINNATGAPGSDGVADPSGAHFINLTNLLVSRDNARQSVADLYRLTHLITSGAADFNGDGTPEINPAALTFVGSSLGAIVGTTFVTTEPAIRFANLNVGGARIASLLRNSQTFGPRINAGLAAAGVVNGTFLYDLFFLVAQTIIDDADPINYATHTFDGSLAGGVSTFALIQEMIGDTVVPNSATTDLARAMGTNQVDAVQVISGLAQVAAPFEGSGIFQYAQGGHGAILDPSSGPTAAIQTQSLTYLVTGLLSGMPTIVNPLPKREIDFGIESEIEPQFLNFFPLIP